MPIKFTKEHFRWTNGRGHGQKPILYSQKKNKDGLGKKQHSSDQWWEKAFDNQLKGLDVTSVGGEVTVKQTAMNVKATSLEKIAKCYIRFVRGGMLQGGKEITGVGEWEMEAGGEVGSEKTRAGAEGDGGKLREKKKEERRKKKDERAERRQRKLCKKTVEGKAERRQRKSLKRVVEREMAALGRGKEVVDS